MGEIKDFINLYIEDSGMIEKELNELTMNLTANIQNQLEPGHGWITGNLHDSINSNVKSHKGSHATIEAYTKIEYAPFVDDGHTLRNGEWWEGYHFMEKGLDETVAMYR